MSDKLSNSENMPDSEPNDSKIQHIKHVSGLYKDWFLDYASYVILERAVPYLYDGLKPVQRRLLHSMKRMDDGRYNKVANIIGHTMQFHPHGDASIGDALVALGQKDLLVDTQGNWGNVLTGDRAAASRYIEARLTKFANEVVFNPKTTTWKASYDGRNKEPLYLPVKFPLLLAQGVEGIAVGLASKILPHNFNELIDASIAHLKKEEFVIYPDFPTGGMADVSKYNDGLRGGQIKVRSKIEKVDNKTLAITEIPFGRTTTSLIDSIIKAIDKGKIKIKKIDDNTASDVEILLTLPNGVSPDETIDALYVFTDCELSISPNSCLIQDNKPQFLGVSEILKRTTDNTLELLRLELQIRMGELQESWHNVSLERIFIMNEVYNVIKTCKTESEILSAIDEGLKPYVKELRREVTKDDCVKLSNIPIKRISKYSKFKAEEHIRALEDEMKEVQHHLDTIVQYTIDYYQRIKDKYGAKYPRKTEIRNFEAIDATEVVAVNAKLYVNRKDGFIGTGMKKEEFLFDCSDIDDVIVYKADGTYVVTKVSEKAFVGKDIIHVNVFKKNDDRSIYNVVYRDGDTGFAYMKRFAVGGVTRDKEYNLTKGSPKSKIIYFSFNPNGEAEIVKVYLRPRPKLKKTVFELDFSTLAIKSRNVMGNILTKHAVHRIQQIEEGVSTLGGLKVWYDDNTFRLNTDERGQYLGEFKGSDKIIYITKDGEYCFTTYELANHYPEGMLLIEKWVPNKVFTAIFYDADQKYPYLKRFELEQTSKQTNFIGENPKSQLLGLSGDKFPQVQIEFAGKHSNRETELIDAEEFIAVKGYKARGKRLTTYEYGTISFAEPLQKEVDEPSAFDKTDNDDDDLDPEGYTGEQASLF